MPSPFLLSLLVFHKAVDRLGRHPKLPCNPGCAPTQLDEPARGIAAPLPRDSDFNRQTLHIGVSGLQLI